MQLECEDVQALRSDIVDRPSDTHASEQTKSTYYFENKSYDELQVENKLGKIRVQGSTKM